jgi:hypothetical protein
MKLARRVAVIGAALTVVAAVPALPAHGKARRKACVPVAPQGPGADAPITLVTPGSREEKPTDVEATSGAGVGAPGDEASTTVSRTYANIQVDPGTSTAKMSVLLGFWIGFDHDLYVRDATGAIVAESAGPNLGQRPPISDGSGGTRSGAEQVDDVPVRRCDVFTIEIVTTLGPGSDPVATGGVALHAWFA